MMFWQHMQRMPLYKQIVVVGACFLVIGMGYDIEPSFFVIPLNFLFVPGALISSFFGLAALHTLSATISFFLLVSLTFIFMLIIYRVKFERALLQRMFFQWFLATCALVSVLSIAFLLLPFFALLLLDHI